MRRTLLAVLLALVGACGGDDPTEPGEPPVLRVLLGRFADSDEVEISLVGPWRFLDADQGEVLETGTDLRLPVSLRETQLPRPLRIVPESGRLAINGRPYPGHLLIRKIDGVVTLLLETDLESYLPGVLAGEMSARFHPAALRAQAVMARTYASHRRAERGEDAVWHVADDTRDQMFLGIPGPAVFSEAVEHTRGLVLSGADGVLPGWYHSTCGGHTAAAVEVFGVADVPSLVGVPCGYCSISPRFRWDPPLRLPMADVTERLGLDAPPTSVEIVLRRRDGRAARIRFQGTTPREFSGEELRNRLGVERLRSTLIHGLRIDGDALVCTGGGSGHGVGLCQWGAEGMARAGASAADILTHYAPGAVIGRVY